ncbi:MAG: GmrSD restriction endonuclease domain-containing protein [Candidatus Nitrosopumilus sp. bin_68KS]
MSHNTDSQIENELKTSQIHKIENIMVEEISDNITGKITTYDDFLDFLETRLTSHTKANYQPIVIKKLLEDDGSSLKSELYSVLLKNNPSLESKKISRIPVFDVLEDKITETSDEKISLLIKNLTKDQKEKLIQTCNDWLKYIDILESLNTLELKGIPERHISALKWFFKRIGQNYTRQGITSGRRAGGIPEENLLSEDQILHDRIKGVYKPKGDDYAQSIQLIPQSKGNLEIDRDHPTLLINYDLDDATKNKKQMSWLRKCHEADIPIGIFFRIAENKYKCLGLGKITKQKDTLFQIEYFGVSDERSKWIKEEALEEYDNYNSDPEIDKIKKINWDELFKTVDPKQQRFLDLQRSIKTLERQPTHISEIIDEIQDCKWVIPNFQRYYDWKKDDVKDFLTSIFNEQYVGSILLWKADQDEKLDTIPVHGVKSKKQSEELVVLDGQQRITSLNYTINPPEFAKKEKRDKRFPGYFYIDFNAYLHDSQSEDIILVSDEKLEDKITLERLLFPFFKLNHVEMNSWIQGLEDRFSESSEREQLKINQIGNIIRNKLVRVFAQFEIPRIVLPETVKFDSVAVIFENLNSKGKPLNTFDLLNVRLSRYNVPLKDLWDETLEDYPKIKEYFEEEPKITKINRYIIESISLAHTELKSCKRKDILDLYVKNKMTVQSFTEKWQEMSKYVEDALEYLEDKDNGFGVLTRQELPYEPMIPILAALRREITENFNSDQHNCMKKVHYWYWSSIFDVRFSSGVESKKSGDFTDLVEWFANDVKVPTFIKNFRENYDSKLKLRDVRSADNTIYRGVYCMLTKNNAVDPEHIIVIDGSKLHKDHIFPKSKFKIKELEGLENSILNMTWLTKDTNTKTKRDRVPSKYIAETIKEKFRGDEDEFLQVLNSHFINQRCLEFLKNDQFEKFVDERENILLEEIRKIIGAPVNKEEKTMIKPETPYENVRILRRAVESCMDYVYWTDKYFDFEDFDILLDGTKKNNVKEIRIISILKEMDTRLRSHFLRFKKDMKGRGITCEMRVAPDPKIFQNHDRWIISKNISYNAVSGSTARKGDYGSVTPTTEVPPFEEWWKTSLDVDKRWDEIKPKLGQAIRHQATCTTCGKEFSVPFVPDGIRPVFCHNCR